MPYHRVLGYLAATNPLSQGSRAPRMDPPSAIVARPLSRRSPAMDIGGSLSIGNADEPRRHPWTGRRSLTRTLALRGDSGRGSPHTTCYAQLHRSTVRHLQYYGSPSFDLRTAPRTSGAPCAAWIPGRYLLLTSIAGRCFHPSMEDALNVFF